MISNKSELKADVREQTGYPTAVLDNGGLDTAYRSAKRHLRVEKNLSSDYTWYSTDKPEAVEALFWFTCLFAKVQTGELDSQDLQTGAVDMNALLAKDDDQVTEWFRRAQQAKRSMKASSIIQATSPARTDREYTPDSAGFGNSTGGTTSDDFDI